MSNSRPLSPAVWGAAAALVIAGAAATLAAQAGDPPPRSVGHEPHDLSSLPQHMAYHHALAHNAWTYVVLGDLERSRDAVLALESHRAIDGMPDAWRPYVVDLKEAASKAGDSWTLDEAGPTVAHVALACAECHKATGGGPRQRHYRPAPADGSEFADKMVGHEWAMEQLWLGLMQPNDAAWTAGATALTDGTFLPGKAKATPAAQVHVAKVEGLGRRAAAADDPEARAVVYGELLATCASCHRMSGVAPRLQLLDPVATGRHR